MPETDVTPTAVVLGVGNPLYGDDGFGVEALDALAQRYRFGRAVCLVDGGTEGLGLLGLIEDASELIILDAVAGPGHPGDCVEVAGDGLCGATPLSLSEHQVSIREVLGLAAWRGRLPQRTVLLGVVAERLDLGPGLSPAVSAAMPVVLERTAEWLARWGYPPEPREVIASHA
ncbi:MAG TPA: hydrogenase maturation protease [Symbiobacteriaceae bacterium]|nr:hydrogenase maturation protease [Symbiobacteriaceae bacterium]